MAGEETGPGCEDRLGLDEAQWVWFLAYTRGYGQQDDNGVDVSALRENLKLSPTERVERLLRARELIEELRRAGAAARPAPAARGS
jgi:hypothetical protein